MSIGANLLGSVIVVLAALSTVLSLVDPAFAPPAVPAPDVGGGLPGFVIVGGVLGALWFVRMRRRHRTD